MKRQTILVNNGKGSFLEQTRIDATFSQWMFAFGEIHDKSKKSPSITKLKKMYDSAILPDEAIRLL